MKKLLFILAAAITIFLIWLYVFIPGKITIARSLKIEANRTALYRKLGDNSTWKEWWPGTIDGSGTFNLNDEHFQPGPTRTLSIAFNIEDKYFSTTADLTLVPVLMDSTILHIESSITVPNNPFKRLKTYFGSGKLGDNFSAILQSLNKTYSKIAGLYDFDIQKKHVVDSILIFTSGETKGYPTVGKVYAMIDELKDYIKKHLARETGFPMQNIYTADSINYLIKVAIPADRRLPDSDKIHYRWMLPGGNILITEVKGGQKEINKAYQQIINYISEYGRTSPAIPFESLVTDRRKEPDSTKWITRIYYPVM